MDKQWIRNKKVELTQQAGKQYDEIVKKISMDEFFTIKEKQQLITERMMGNAP